MILPPLYYGMHRFQTLLRNRQQTLCLRSFLNDAVTACDPKKQTNKKKENKEKQTKVQKAWFHREEKYQLWIPGWMWGPGARGKDGCCVKRKPRPSCFSASGEHEHRPKKHSCDTFWFNVEATVQVTILDFFLLKVFFLFTSLQTKRPKTNKKTPILLIKQTRKVTKALLWGVMGKNEHLYAFSGSSEIKTG